MTSLSKLAYHNNFNKITESLINFFNQELNCDNWDLIKIPDKKKKKYYPTFTHFRNLVLPANNKIWLSTNTVSILTKNKNIRFEKITTLKNMSLYEELILNNFSHRLIIPILNEEDFIVGIISLYFGSISKNDAIIQKITSIKDYINSAILHCFHIHHLQKKIDRYIIKAKYREFYNDITKIFETAESKNDFFIKVANEINLFLGINLIIYRAWNKHTARLSIENICSTKPSNLKINQEYKLTETIANISFNKNKTIYKILSPKNAKYKDEIELLNEGIKTIYLFPIIAKDEAIGDVIFASSEIRFSKNILNLFREIKHFMTHVFLNYHFHRLLQERIKALNLILKITQEISSCLDLNKTINESLSSIIEHFQYDNAAVLLKTPDNKHLYIHSAVGYEPDVIKHIHLKIGEEGITGAAAALGETIIIDDVSKDPRYIQGVKGAKWEMAIPLKVGNDTIGVFDVESKSEHRVDTAELSTLEILAAHIASAISNSLLFTKESKRASQLNAIHKIAATTAKCTNIDSLIKNTINLFASIFDYYAISFWKYDKIKNILVPLINIGKNVVVPNEQKLENTLMGLAVKNKISLIENNAQESNLYTPIDNNVLSEICSPIIIDNEVYGVIDVQSNKYFAFDKQDFESLEIISQHLAMSIKKLLLISELHKQAITDPLTGLYNRRYFNNILSKEIHRAIRMQRDLSLIIADLDDFKKINDNFGHLAGDNVLIKIAQILNSNIRNIDYLARIGGDEFAIILPETNIKNAYEIAERLRLAISKSEIEPIKNITASFGVASFSSLINTADEFITQADNAMYQAKKLGKDRVFKW